MELSQLSKKVMQKIGCGKSVKIGYNKILDCPINFQCGMSEDGGEIMYCENCKRIKEGRGNVTETIK